MSAPRIVQMAWGVLALSLGVGLIHFLPDLSACGELIRLMVE